MTSFRLCRVVLVFLCVFSLSRLGFSASPIDSEIQQLLSGSGQVVSSRWNRRVNRGFIVVPIYRELYNENLGYLLSSVASQQGRAEHPIKLELVLIVNHTADSAEHIKRENRETVAFLRRLAAGQSPVVRPESVVLREGAARFLASGVQLHVLDHTQPGFVDRNIGRVRDIANQYALALLRDSELDTTFIAQLDADCLLPESYLRKVQDLLSRGSWDYLMTDLTWEMERGSPPALFRRVVVDALDFAMATFLDTLNKNLPRSGSPRIVTLARTLRHLGGVPHFTHGEDTELARRLRESARGVFAYNLAVTTRYRGRPDGYDASYFLSRADQAVQLDPLVQDNLGKLDEVERDLARRNPAVFALAGREREGFIHKHEEAARFLLSRLREALGSLAHEAQLSLGREHALFQAGWFEQYLRGTFATYGSVEATLLAVQRDFPQQLAIPATNEIKLLGRIQSLVRALRFEAEFPNWNSAPAQPSRQIFTAPAMTHSPVSPQFVAPLPPLRIEVVSSNVNLFFITVPPTPDTRTTLSYVGQNISQQVLLPRGRAVELWVSSSNLQLHSDGVPIAVRSTASNLTLPHCAQLLASQGDTVGWR